MSRFNFSKLATLVKHGNNGVEFDLKTLFWVLSDREKIVLGNPRFYKSIPAAVLEEFCLSSRNGSSFVARFDPNLRNCSSIVGKIPRTIPSVPRDSCLVCGHRIDWLLHDAVAFSARSISNNSGHGALHSNYFVNKPAPMSRNLSVSLPHGTKPCLNQHSGSSRRKTTNSMIFGTNLVHKQLSPNTARMTFQKNSHSFCGFHGFHTSTISSVDDAAASEEPLDSNLSGPSSDQNIPLEKLLKLLCGSCCLPHPDKEETGGEDAHFICLNEQVIGVADGVGGWADLGIDAGKYSKELMSNAKAAVLEEPVGLVDPARVLEKAHAKTKVQGSSTACILALSDQTLHAINLGDSGFVVIRDGSTVFKSPVQQHDFNFPYQLENGNIGDLPSSGEVFKVSVSPGDVIVAGTDGLFDNLYNNDICGAVVHSVRAGFGPHIAAQKIAALARERAEDTKRQTPFATAAQDAGLRYHGGKLDDITVIVSYIASSAN